MVELMCAVTVILAAVLGAGHYRYYAIRDAHRAELHITAARLAVGLLESWKGAGCSDTFDPVSQLGGILDIDSGSSGEPPPGLSDATLAGSWRVVVGGTSYFMTLSHADQISEPKLINVAVAWSRRDPESDLYADADASHSMTTYQGY